MSTTPDAETIYNALRATAEEHGYVGDHADDLLSQAAESMAADPLNEDDDRGPNARFQMYSRAGNDAVAKMIGDAFGINQDVPAGAFRAAIQNTIRVGIGTVGRVHPEITDTEPRYEVVSEVNRRLDAAGFKGFTEDDLF